MRGEGYSLSDIAAATGNGNNGFGFGGDGAWWIIILFLFVFCGWGNGFNGNGGSNGGGSVMDAYVLNSDFATLQRLIADGFNSVNSGINQVNQGICNLGYSTLENFNTTNMGVATGFANLNNALCNQSFQIERGITNLGSQLADCCCQNARAIDGVNSNIQNVNYNMAMNTNSIQNSMCLNTRDIIDNQNANTRNILDFLVNDKISSLENENQALRLSASQEKQNNYLVSELGPKQPVPAYPVFPTTSFAYPTGVAFGVNGLNGYNNGCCGCGC